MVRLIRYAAYGALSLLLVAAPAAAKHPRPTAPPSPPAHNFVNVDLTASVPVPPGPGSFRYSVVLLDAASVVRSGNTVTFDTLSISRSFGHYMSGNREVGPPEGTIVFN